MFRAGSLPSGVLATTTFSNRGDLAIHSFVLGVSKPGCFFCVFGLAAAIGGGGAVCQWPGSRLTSPALHRRCWWQAKLAMAITILDEIIQHKRRHEVPQLPPVDRAALTALAPCRGFAAALQRHGSGPIRVIAESKKGSPSKGVFTEDYDPLRNAYAYQLGGASCLSILTDERYFFGHLDHLLAVRAAVELPLIRKDFVIDERQIAEARLAGADAVLLIVACLEPGLLRDLHGFARELGLDVLVEVHNAEEAHSALHIDAALIGVNNRNLHDFSVSLQTTYDLLPALVDGQRVVVSESGITERAQCQRLEEAGVDAILVGETLMRAGDPSACLRQLRGQPLSSGLL